MPELARMTWTQTGILYFRLYFVMYTELMEVLL